MMMRAAISAAALAASYIAGSAHAQDMAPNVAQGAEPIIVLPANLDQPYVAPARSSDIPIDYDPVLETPNRQDSAIPYNAPTYGAPSYGAPYTRPYIAEPYRESAADIPYSANYERGAWLDYCRANYLDGNGFDRSGALGGVLGAAVGGLVGNRIAGGNRLAGTLIGAGTGGLAGAAIGSALDQSRRRDRLDDCEIYLERTAGNYARQPVSPYGAPMQPPQGTMFYGPYGQPMMLVPVMVPIRQRAVVREYVTEEFVD